MLKLVVVNAGDLQVDLSRLQQALNAWRQLQGQINVKLVSDAEIQELNRRYAGEDHATDVLSFPYDNADEIGDIAISLDTAARQAQQAGIGLADEVQNLALHGVLHILGYDHAIASQRQEMVELHDQIAAAAGLKDRNIIGNN